MAFIEKKFEPKNYEEYKDIVKAIGHLGHVNRWLVDDSRKIHFFDLGGRGEMPASTGAPPNRYILVINSGIYYFGLRFSYIDGKFGGVICEHSVEIMECLWSSLSKEEVIALLREALTECEVIRRKRVDAEMPEDVVVISP